MALHIPTQRLDFLYVRNENVIYLRASITIELNGNESIPTNNVVVDASNAPDFVVNLNILENNTDQDGRYEYPLTVLIPTNVNEDVDITSDDTDRATDEVKNYISNELTSYGATVYSVNTRAMIAGVMDGEVTNTISEDGEIEIQD